MPTKFLFEMFMILQRTLCKTKKKKILSVFLEKGSYEAYTVHDEVTR